jgi:hypothetical protein
MTNHDAKRVVSASELVDRFKRAGTAEEIAADAFGRAFPMAEALWSQDCFDRIDDVVVNLQEAFNDLGNADYDDHEKSEQSPSRQIGRMAFDAGWETAVMLIAQIANVEYRALSDLIINHSLEPDRSKSVAEFAKLLAERRGG